MLHWTNDLFAVPVIAVFTKYDNLINHVEYGMDRSRIIGLSEENIYSLVKNDAETALRAICTGPLEERVGNKVPYITVSSESWTFPYFPRHSDVSSQYHKRGKDTKPRLIIW